MIDPTLYFTFEYLTLCSTISVSIILWMHCKWPYMYYVILYEDEIILHGDIVIYFFNFHTKAFVPTCVCYCLTGTLVDYLSFVLIL